MSRIKRSGLYATPLLVLAIIVTTWIQLLKPLAIKFIAEQIPYINSSQNFVSLQVEKIDLSLLRLQLIVQGLKLEFKNDSDKLQPFFIDNASLQLDIFDLIIGHINLSKIIIDGAKWSYNLPAGPTQKKKQIPFSEIFKFLEIIPIDRIIIYDSSVQLAAAGEAKSLVKLQIPQLTIINIKNEISLSVVKLGATVTQNEKNSFSLESDINLLLNNNELNFNKIELRALDSHIGITAKITNIADLMSSPVGHMKFRSKINLEDLRTISLILFPQKKRISSVMGVIESNGELNLKSFNDIKGAVDISTTQVVLDHFKLGQAQIKATLNNNQVEINEISIEHPAGSALIKNVKFENRSPYNFSTSLEVSNFELQKLFLSLGLNAIPADLSAMGKSFCTGAILPTPIATCEVESEIKDIWVKANIKSKSHILKLKKAKLTGKTRFTKDGVSYETDILLGNSKGTSSGAVIFKNGFDIKYATDHLSFNDVESLAGLNIAGDLKIAGTAHGNSSSGVIHAKISAHNAEIDSFRLGNFDSLLDYEDAQLKFRNIVGNIGKSSIAGDLILDFKNSSLSGEFQAPNLYAGEVLQILNKKFALPFDLSGNGSARLKLKGPLDFWRLSYDLNSEFNNGSIAGENFIRLDLNITADGDNITFNKVRLKKLKSELVLNGNINTIPKEPLFNLKIKANPILLEEIDHVITYASDISGTGYAEGQITGPLNSPEILTNFTLNQVSYDKIDYPNSQGKIIINKNYLDFSGQFFGRQIQSNITWPWNENDRFSAKVLIHDLNPLFLLPLFSIPQPSSDFYSRLSAEIDLTSKNRNLSSADGYIKLTEFILKRGTQSIKLEKPSQLIFKSGLTQMENISLQGHDSFFNVQLSQNSTGLARLNINADLQLKMLHFLVPFAQSLSGNLVIDSQILLRKNSFELLGDGELIDGFISMKGFPQAIENINTPIEFSKSKILLSDITGQLGRSDVTGFGQIELIGPKNILVNLRAIADNVELNFPDKILTSGKASILFSGSWLPYNLKIDYKVAQGLVENDFEPDTSQSLSLQASSFLPPKQIEQLSPSLALDINVDLTKGILIKNKLIEGEATGLLNISGSPEIPVIKGKINIKPGSKLIFKDKPFNIQTALVNFQQEKEINPDIYISANARISDYDINLLVQGPAKNLSIKATSQPPLSEPDLFSLLALGVTSQTDHNLSSETQQKQTGLEVLAAISNQSQLNKKIQQKLGLTVQLAPSIDSTKNIAVPKVVVSKKISEKINASYSKPFTGNDQNQEIKLQYLYNNNLSLHLNYQNKDTLQQDQVSGTSSNSTSIFGIALEYRDEFK